MFAALMLSASLVSTAVALDYDLVFKNGRVMDPETMFDGAANVGVKDGRIAVITKKKITGKETKGRFEPITEENWEKTYYASPVDFGGGGVPGSQPNYPSRQWPILTLTDPRISHAAGENPEPLEAIN